MRPGIDRATLVAAYVQIGLLVFTVVYNTAFGGHFDIGVFGTQVGALLVTLGLLPGATLRDIFRDR